MAPPEEPGLSVHPLPARYSALTPAQRAEVREQYALRQAGRCYWCKAPLGGPPAEAVRARGINRALFPPGFFRHRVHLQHSRATGMTEGAVHARCNAVMWQYHGR